jgi:mannose-6-phosphate isomerase-like protein (cupin superfamily)
MWCFNVAILHLGFEILVMQSFESPPFGAARNWLGMPPFLRPIRVSRLELVTIAGQTLGRATYQPGWKWSVHVGPGVNVRRCSVEQLGIVLAGHATAAFDDGRIFDLTPGTLFYIPPEPHHSWVVGDAPYVSLHLLGAARSTPRRRRDDQLEFMLKHVVKRWTCVPLT